jgi:hypothetical protein
MPWSNPIDPTTGQLVTPANYLTPVYESLNFLEEVHYKEFVSPVSITATTEATAQTIVEADAITYEAVPHIIVFESPSVVAGVASLFLLLQDGATVLGRLASWAASTRSPVHRERRLIPTAASHTYKITAHNASAATSTIDSGVGGAGVNLPGFIRIYRVPT